MVRLAKNILPKLIQVAAISALLMGIASAQSLMPGITLKPDSPSRPLTADEVDKQQAVDKAYKSAIDKIPDTQKSADPWGNIRSNPPTSPNTKQGRQ